MRHHRLSWITAAATAVALIAPLPASAAPMPARAIAPADVTTPTVVKHVDTDVDGDGTRDSVTLTYLGADRFTLSATTTAGKTSTVSFSSAFETTYPYTPNVAWYGASAIDGRKGSELIVTALTKSSANAESSLALRVYTWRSGNLVTEKAPASPWGKAWKVDNGDNLRAAGYRFFSSHGHRYVDATRMTWSGRSTASWKGTTTRSAWRGGKWVKVSSRKAKSVRTTDDLAWGQVGIAGPKLLLGQLNVDISGDEASDLVLLYRTGAQAFHARVSANGHVASAVVFPYGRDPFIGAAEVDGVAGREIIARVYGGDAPEWKVLGWRNNALIEVPGPLGNRWFFNSDEDEVNFALSSESGSHYVVVSVTEWGHHTGQPAHFGRFVWDVDHWAEQSAWDDVLSAEQAAAFHVGFTAPDLVTP